MDLGCPGGSGVQVVGLVDQGIDDKPEVIVRTVSKFRLGKPTTGFRAIRSGGSHCFLARGSRVDGRAEGSLHLEFTG